MTYIADDRELSDGLEYCEPYADVLTALRDGSTSFTDQFVSIKTYLKPVVE